MRKRWLLNLVLLLVLAGLGGLAWYVEQAPSGQRLLAVDPAAIHRLRIQRTGAEDVRLRREDGHWWIVAPERVAASAFHIEQILREAETASLTSYALSDLDLEPLGLDPPRVRLELAGGWGEEALLYGGTDAVDGLRYVQAGGRIHLINNRTLPLLEAAWWNFIDRRLVPPDVELVGVETPGYTLSGRGGQWRLSVPQGQGSDAGPGEHAKDGMGREVAQTLSRKTLSQDTQPEQPLDAARLAADWAGISALVVRQVRRQPRADAPVTLRFSDGSSRGFAPDSDSGEHRLVDVVRGFAYVFDPESLAYLLQGRLPDRGEQAQTSAE